VEEKHYHSPSFSWPYFSYATKNNKVFIYNAFNHRYIQRYELPSHVAVIADTFVTDHQDCFVIVETEDEYFEVYHIDLDSE
jgi:hypothetical protein